eukprot:g1456.t1
MPEPTPVLPEVLAQIDTLPVSSRPLIICDVDEVILHMIAHLEDYLHARDLRFLNHEYRLTGNIGRRTDHHPLPADDVKRHLRDFFDEVSHQQDIVPGAETALRELSETWDVVLLTNLPGGHNKPAREKLLSSLGVPFPVVTNSGPKGGAVAALSSRRPNPVVFIDDSPTNHTSVNASLPASVQIQFIADERFLSNMQQEDHIDLLTELDQLSIAHIDCDAFYAAVEKRDNPELQDQPVIVGGGQRGVVSTCCYIARIYGVRSAMPMFKAMEACPQAVVIKPNMEKYAKIGKEIRERMRALTPLVEPLSIDEAFLDLTGTERLHRAVPAEILARFIRELESDIGITASVGLAPNKFLAKLASDLEKPRGFSVIGAAEAEEVLAAMPVGRIWGVGKVFQKKLEKDGIRTIGQLQEMEAADLARRYGTIGLRLARLSHGDDSRDVTPQRGAKSVSSETTFRTDISSFDTLRPILRNLSEKVSARLKKSELSGRGVTLKLKTADFKTITRARHLQDPTQLADRIFSAGVDLLAAETDGRRFRLIGIGVSDLETAEQADPQDLVDPNAERRKNAELAVDRLRDKFGKSAVELGLTHAARSDRDAKKTGGT